jgi:chemosensory pili system protein ChpA (sensor histidine kinase/response regulator)
MRLQDDLDFTTLNWVKQELDETLKQARQALEQYVEDPADSSLMRFCATYLHQVQGTLRMVELYGAAMVVEEMERVASALLDTQIRQREEAYSVLMRGIVQLPDYLERLQSGHKDIPIVLLPLLNDLRACRGEKLLSESVLFSPDLAAPLPAAAAGAQQPVPELELRALAARLRNNFQVGLLHWFRNTRPDEALAGLIGTLDRLRGISMQDEARRLWWIAAGVLDGVRIAGIDVSPALKVLFGRVDREIKRLADVGEGAFRVEPPRELVKNLLYYVAHARAGTERTREIARTYALEQLLPSQAELDHAKGSLAGKNRALLDTVSAAIKEDLMRVKDALDLYLRSGAEARPADLAAQTDLLDRVADTLGIMGLGVPRRVVQEQRQVLADVASGQRAADEGVLLDVAGALLYVEASLDDNIDTLGASADVEPEARTELELPQAEVKRILDALMKEASANLAQAKQDIVAFVESPWDHDKVIQIPRLLEEIAGALRMLQLEAPAELVGALVRFIDVELIRLKRVPTPEQMDRLADSLASVEYYLEAARDQRAGRDKILDVTRRSLEALGYWPLPSDDAATAGIDDVAGAVLEQPDAQMPVAAVVEPQPEPMTLPTAAALVPEEFVAPPQADEFGFPTIEISSEPLDEYIARIGDVVEAPQAQDAAAGSGETAESPLELTSAVEIHPGTDVVDLAIGESAAEAVSPPPPAHDFAGLRFAETSVVEALQPAPAAVVEPVVEYDWVDIEEEVDEEVELPPEPAVEAAVATFQDVPSDDIDDEIREVFVEEVQEEIDNLNRQLPAWRADTHDLERLKPIRRSFHTLKGSGRLVGAMALGEFSWKVENMLNRVLDKTIPASPAVVALLEHAIGALPNMLDALRGAGAPRVDIAGIMEVADKLASGEEAWLSQPAPRRAVVKVKRTRRVQVPRLVQPVPAAPASEVAEVANPVELTRTLDLVTELDEPVAVTAVDEFVAPVETTIAIADVVDELSVADSPIDVVDIAIDAGIEADAEALAGALADFDVAAVTMDEAVVAVETIEAPERAAAARADQAVVPDLDPMLLEILRSEVEGHLGVVQAYLDAAGRQGEAQPVTEPLLRAVHTMHGAVSMADVPVVNDVVGPLEGYFKRLRGSGVPPTAVGLAAISDATALIGRVLSVLDQPGVPVPGSGILSERLAALRDGLPEPQSQFAVFDVDLDDVAPEPATASEAAVGLDTGDAVDAVVPAIAEQAGVDLASGLEVDFTPNDLSVDALIEPLVEEADVAVMLDGESTLLDADSADAELAAAMAASADLSGDIESSLLDAGLFAGDEPAAQDETIASALVDETEPAELAPDRGEYTIETVDAVAFDAQLDDADLGLATLAIEHVEARAESVSEQPLDTAAAPVIAEPVPLMSDAALAADESAVDQPVQSFEVEAFDLADDTVDSELAAVELATADVADATVDAVADVVVPEEPAAAVQPVAQPLLRFTDDPYPDGALELTDVDDELIEIFVEEGNDLLDKSDAYLARLREVPTEREPVIGLQRNLHTLKGNARAVGLAGIGDLSHAMESLLEGTATGDQPLSGPALALYERAFDRLHQMVGRVARRQAVGVPTQMIDRFERLVAGEDIFAGLVADVSAAEAPIAGAPEVAIDVAAPAVEPVAEPAAAPTRPAPRPLPEIAEEEPTLRTSQELIRVRSDLLDALVNFAGEVSIYRSRLEQQIGSFRFNLVELDATVLRLREQLRKLEIETEAQILSRFQREAEAAGGEGSFDPLELDRFSTLQQLSRALAESVSDLQSLQNTLDDQTRQAETLLLQQSRVSSELQEGLMRTRMVPFDSVVPFLRRLLRQTSDELGRRTSLRIEGAQGEMDRNLLERMKAPFEHMLRNAVAHGVETPDERRAAGKPEEGLVRIAVSREATEVVIRISDDGKGMDRDAIRAKAIERGLLRPDAQLSDRDLFGFVLESGFSTAREVTKIAGRGVGMDVVAAEIKQLGGTLAIDSTRGRGTEFTIRLPFTLAVTQAILVRLADQIYALPMSSVQGVARMPREDFDRRIGQANPSFTYAGEDYTIHELNALLGLSVHRTADDAQLPVLLSRSGDQRAAIRIDGVLGSREIVVKSVGPQVSSVPGILGATIMGDGSVVMILDLPPLVRRSAALREESRVEQALEDALPGLISEPATIVPAVAEPAVEQRRLPLVMVVDDSITMRKVTSRVLERHDMEVVTAKDGLDAVEKLQDRVPDLMLLDIEMPRMDGYELATYMRNDARLRTVPIIMITSRTGEKHRQRAFEIGVDRYLGKPYQEADLLRNVEETLRLSRAAH